MNKLRIASQNFRQSRPDKHEVKQELKSTDILFAQEINWQQNTTTDFITKLEKELDCKIFKCEGTGKQHLVTQAILPIEQSIPRSTYIHPPAVNAAKGAF